MCCTVSGEESQPEAEPRVLLLSELLTFNPPPSHPQASQSLPVSPVVCEAWDGEAYVSVKAESNVLESGQSPSCDLSPSSSNIPEPLSPTGLVSLAPTSVYERSSRSSPPLTLEPSPALPADTSDSESRSAPSPVSSTSVPTGLQPPVPPRESSVPCPTPPTAPTSSGRSQSVRERLSRVADLIEWLQQCKVRETVYYLCVFLFGWWRTHWVSVVCLLVASSNTYLMLRTVGSLEDSMRSVAQLSSRGPMVSSEPETFDAARERMERYNDFQSPPGPGNSRPSSVSYEFQAPFPPPECSLSSPGLGNPATSFPAPVAALPAPATMPPPAPAASWLPGPVVSMISSAQTAGSVAWMFAASRGPYKQLFAFFDSETQAIWDTFRMMMMVVPGTPAPGAAGTPGPGNPFGPNVLAPTAPAGPSSMPTGGGSVILTGFSMLIWLKRQLRTPVAPVIVTAAAANAAAAPSPFSR